VLSDQTARLFLAQYRRFAPVHDVLGSAHRMRRIDRMLVMAAGSILGAFIGGQLLGFIPNFVLLSLLAVILALSAVKVWTHK